MPEFFSNENNDALPGELHEQHVARKEYIMNEKMKTGFGISASDPYNPAQLLNLF
jgi:hypothetical protein